MKKIILVFCLILIFPLTTFASSEKISEWKTSEHIQFLSEEGLDTILPNGIKITFLSPSLALFNSNFPGSYTQRYGSLFTTNASVICNGVNINITNNSDQVLVIKWSDSNLSMGNYSGMPFLDGMKFKDAGNQAFTPDTVIPPGKIIAKSVYPSSVTFSGSSWNIGGEPIPKDNTMKISLYLKIIDSNGAYKYYSAISPAIGIPQNISQNKPI